MIQCPSESNPKYKCSVFSITNPLRLNVRLDHVRVRFWGAGARALSCRRLRFLLMVALRTMQAVICLSGNFVFGSFVWLPVDFVFLLKTMSNLKQNGNSEMCSLRPRLRASINQLMDQGAKKRKTRPTCFHSLAGTMNDLSAKF